jgi:hypothetical protein
MAKQYTYDDIPNILNSISWQLKRIADSLEDSQEDSNSNELTPTVSPTVQLSKLRQLIESVK